MLLPLSACRCRVCVCGRRWFSTPVRWWRTQAAGQQITNLSESIRPRCWYPAQLSRQIIINHVNYASCSAAAVETLFSVWRKVHNDIRIGRDCRTAHPRGSPCRDFLLDMIDSCRLNWIFTVFKTESPPQVPIISGTQDGTGQGSQLAYLVSYYTLIYRTSIYKNVMSILFLNIFALVALAHSPGSLFHSFIVHCENAYFLIYLVYTGGHVTNGRTVLRRNRCRTLNVIRYGMHVFLQKSSKYRSYLVSNTGPWSFNWQSTLSLVDI